MVSKTRLVQFAHLSIACLVLGFLGLFQAIGAQSALPEYDQYGRWQNGITEAWFFRSEAYSEAEAGRARRNWSALGAENEHATNEWAGDYRRGDLHGAFLRWSEKGFVLMSVFTCEANVTDVEYGSVSASAGLIQLTAERQRKKRSTASGTHNHGGQAFSSMRLVPIKWGDVRYLVPESQVRAFADYLAGVGVSNRNDELSESWDFYANSTGVEVDLFTTPPVFPPGYEKFRRLPIVGRISSVGRSSVRVDRQNEWWNELIIPVTVDVGKNQGVRPGMGFYLVGQEDTETLEITRVGLHSSRGIITRSVRKKPGVRINEWDDGAPIKSEPIVVGIRLTSSRHQALSVTKPQ